MEDEIADLIDELLPVPEREPWACPDCATLVRKPDAVRSPACGGDLLRAG